MHEDYTINKTLTFLYSASNRDNYQRQNIDCMDVNRKKNNTQEIYYTCEFYFLAVMPTAA